jgi:hypothetical protein
MWPVAWSEELNERGFIDEAMVILSKMPSCAARTPWLIGSASRTLMGRVREESESHMQGRAFDMSPMYSETEILAPDEHIMGLAWNVISLSMIAPAYAALRNFVVEGDHVHVQPAATLWDDAMPVAFTMPTWYPWTGELMQSSEGVALNGSFWAFQLQEPGMRLASREEMNQLMMELRKK